jgi:hypothetical protein
MQSSRADNIHLYQISNSSRRIDNDFDSTYFIYSTTIQFQNDPLHYQISRFMYPEDFNAYSRGDEFYTYLEEALGEHARAYKEAKTLQARDQIINETIGADIALVTEKNDIIPLKKLNFNSSWRKARNDKEDIINLFKGYIPSFAIFGIFKHQENITKARQIISDLRSKEMNHDELISYLKQVVESFNPVNAQGEFNRKLYYAIRKLSAANPAPEQELQSIRLQA